MTRLFFLLILLLANSLPLLAAQESVPLVPQNMPATGKVMAALADIKEPIFIPEQTNLLLVGGAVVLGLILLFASWLALRKHAKKPKITPAYKKALQRLSLARELIKEHQTKKFVALAGDTLRTYIEEQFSLSARNKTTREFVEQLTRDKTSMPEQLIRHSKHLHNWLAQMDMVKFAGADLQQDTMEQMLANLQNFIQATAREEK